MAGWMDSDWDGWIWWMDRQGWMDGWMDQLGMDG